MSSIDLPTHYFWLVSMAALLTSSIGIISPHTNNAVDHALATVHEWSKIICRIQVLASVEIILTVLSHVVSLSVGTIDIVIPMVCAAALAYGLSTADTSYKCIPKRLRSPSLRQSVTTAWTTAPRA